MVWEIFHNGIEPFPGMTPMETAQAVLKVEIMSLTHRQLP